MVCDHVVVTIWMDPKEYDVDNLLLEVGQFGLFQIKLFFYFTVQHALIAVIVMSIVFVGTQPDWWCLVKDAEVLRDPNHIPYINEDAVVASHWKCVMYEQQLCIIEVNNPPGSIVVEVNSGYCMNK